MTYVLTNATIVGDQPPIATADQYYEAFDNALGAINPATNLGQANGTATQLDLTSSSGTPTTLTSSTALLAGLYPAADFVKMANITITGPVDLDALNTASHTHANKAHLDQLPAAIGAAGEILQVNAGATGYDSIAIPAGPSNLSPGTRTTTAAPVDNDNGTGVSLDVATNLLAGLASAEHVTNLEALIAQTGEIAGSAAQTAYNAPGNTILTGTADAKTNMQTLADRISTLVGGLVPQGNWNAGANVPDLTAVAQQEDGNLYVVNVAGVTDPGNGKTDWEIGDQVYWANGAWHAVDNTDQVSTVHGRVGAIVSDNGDYTASQVTNVATAPLTSTDVQGAIDELATLQQGATSTQAAILAIGNAINTTGKYQMKPVRLTDRGIIVFADDGTPGGPWRTSDGVYLGQPI